MALESYNYGSVDGDRETERLIQNANAEEAGQCPQRSSGPGGFSEEHFPYACNPLWGRNAKVCNMVLTAAFLVLLSVGLLRTEKPSATEKPSGFSTTNINPSPSYELSKKHKHAVVYDCMLERCSSAFNGIGGVKPSSNSNHVVECLKRSKHYEASTCFENFSALGDKWSNDLLFCCLCESCISGKSLSQAECNLIQAAMTKPLEMAWYPATGSPESLNTWQYSGERFRGDWEKDGGKRFGGTWTFTGLVNGSEYDENLVSEASPSRISPLEKYNPMNAYGCILTRCSDLALKFETISPVVAQQTWQCLSKMTRNTDASSCVTHPTSADIAECGSCKGCFSRSNISDVNTVFSKHAY